MNEQFKIEPMILCKDCKHYRAGELAELDICMAGAEVDLVRGELHSDRTCMNERDPRRSCRPQALNFVPKNLPKTDVLTKRKKV